MYTQTKSQWKLLTSVQTQDGTQKKWEVEIHIFVCRPGCFLESLNSVNVATTNTRMLPERLWRSGSKDNRLPARLCSIVWGPRPPAEPVSCVFSHIETSSLSPPYRKMLLRYQKYVYSQQAGTGTVPLGFSSNRKKWYGKASFTGTPTKRKWKM